MPDNLQPKVGTGYAMERLRVDVVEPVQPIVMPFLWRAHQTRRDVAVNRPWRFGPSRKPRRAWTATIVNYSDNLVKPVNITRLVPNPVHREFISLVYHVFFLLDKT